MCDAGQASMAYFYFDFRDISKQHWHDLVPSLLIQSQVLIVTFYHIIILITATARDSLAMTH